MESEAVNVAQRPPSANPSQGASNAETLRRLLVRVGTLWDSATLIVVTQGTLITPWNMQLREHK